MNNMCTIICQKLRLMLHNSYPITYSYPYPFPYRCTMDEFSRKKKISKARKDISAGYNLLESRSIRYTVRLRSIIRPSRKKIKFTK